MAFSLPIPLAGVSIPLAAILSGPVDRRIKLKERSLDVAASDAARYAARTERLERIITDRSSRLADKIESLRDKPLN